MAIFAGECGVDSDNCGIAPSCCCCGELLGVPFPCRLLGVNADDSTGESCGTSLIGIGPLGLGFRGRGWEAEVDDDVLVDGARRAGDAVAEVDWCRAWVVFAAGAFLGVDWCPTGLVTTGFIGFVDIGVRVGWLNIVMSAKWGWIEVISARWFIYWWNGMNCIIVAGWYNQVFDVVGGVWGDEGCAVFEKSFN